MRGHRSHRAAAARAAAPAVIVALALLAAWAGVEAAPAGALPPIAITIKAACGGTISCESFAFSLKNGSSQALNGLTIQVASPNTITAFSIGGQPAARPTGVQNAWAIYPATIATGATVSGTGTVSAALSSNDVFTIFTTADSFNTAASQDVHLSPAAAASHAAIDPGLLKFAYTPQWSGFMVGKSGVRHAYRMLYDPSFYNIYVGKHEPLGAVKEVFSGSIVGPGSVELAVDRSTGSNRCSWLIDSKGGFRAQPCASPVWLPAKVAGGKWTYTLQRALPPGSYTIESRASSGGSSETVFSAAQHNLVKLVVALRK